MTCKKKVELLYEIALSAISHVGAANYSERQREAMSWVREVMDKPCWNKKKEPTA